MAEPAWEVRYKRSVAAEVRRLDASTRLRVRATIEERLVADPRADRRASGLRERGAGRPLWSFRVGDHCVIYAFGDCELWVLVVRVGQRGGVHREL